MYKMILAACIAGQFGLAVSTQAAVDAPALYHDYCSVCHGDLGDGKSHAQQGLRPPPKDFTSAEVASSLTPEWMFSAIKLGKPGTAMVGWQSRLSDEEITAIVDYIRTDFMRIAASPTVASSAELARGAQIYHGSCSVCHGDTGKGAYWGAASMDPAPRDFTTHGLRQLLRRDRMLASVAGGRPGTAMTAFSGQLSPQDIIDVVEFIRAEFMQQP